MDFIQWEMKVKVGSIFIVASELGLRAVSWKKKSIPMAETLESDDPRVRILALAVTQLGEYFSGERKDFDLPLDLKGTEFQKSVWTCLSEIPYGETCSYRDIADKINNRKAVRAVGSANGKNPIGIVIPCHRVIASDGSLGGYAGGLEAKAQLLEIEKLATP